jgi:L-malate glycosyltransferase
MDRRPLRVLRFTRPGGSGRVAAWSQLARGIVDEITLEHVSELTWQPVPNLPFLAINPTDKTAVQVRLAAAHGRRPGRVAWRIESRVMQRRYAQILDWLATSQDAPVDVVHVHSYREARPLPRLTADVGVPFVLTEHFPFLTRHSAHHRATAEGKRVAERVYHHAAYVLPVSEWLRDELLIAGFRANYRVIHPPIDERVFRPSRVLNDRVMRGRIITAGRLEPVKRIEDLLEAVAVVRAGRADLKLVIAGSGSRLPSLRDTARDLGLEDQVTWLGRVTREQLAEELRASDVFVSTSEVETFGKSIVEALMCGLRVVTTDAGAAASVVRPYGGLVTAVGDTVGLAAALIQATEATTDRGLAVQRAAQVRRAYGRQAAAEKLLECYRDAADAGQN